MANKTVSELDVKTNARSEDVMLIEDQLKTYQISISNLFKDYVTRDEFERRLQELMDKINDLLNRINELESLFESLQDKIKQLEDKIKELEGNKPPTEDPEDPEDPPVDDTFDFANNIIYGYYVTAGENADPTNITLNELKLETTKILKAPLEPSEKPILMCGEHTDACPEPCTYFAIVPKASDLVVYNDDGNGGKVPFDDSKIPGTELHFGCNAVEKVFNDVPVLVWGKIIQSDSLNYMHIVKK